MANNSADVSSGRSFHVWAGDWKNSATSSRQSADRLHQAIVGRMQQLGNLVDRQHVCSESTAGFCKSSGSEFQAVDLGIEICAVSKRDSDMVEVYG